MTCNGGKYYWKGTMIVAPGFLESALKPIVKGCSAFRTDVVAKLVLLPNACMHAEFHLRFGESLPGNGDGHAP